MEYLSIVTLGSDLPQAISALSELITKFECNLVHSRVSVFETDLATMSLVCGNINSIEKLEMALQTLGENQDMTILIKRTQQKTGSANIIPYRAHIVGIDDSVLIHELITFFTEQKATIKDLSLQTTVPNSSEAAVFDLQIALHIPTDVNIHNLRNQFLANCEELNVDGDLQPAIFNSQL